MAQEEAEGAATVSACVADRCQGSPSDATFDESDTERGTDWGQHRRRPSVCDICQAEQGLAALPGLSGPGLNSDSSRAGDVSRAFLSDWAFLSAVAAVASALVLLLLLAYLRDDTGLNELVPKLAMRMLEREGLLYSHSFYVL
ncbi:uncharacterized protein LOC144130100 [Amblyomma americanum]